MGRRDRGRSCQQVGKGQDAAARNPLHCHLEEEEETGIHCKLLAPLHYCSTSAVGTFHSLLQFPVENSHFSGREFSGWAFFGV